MSQSTTLTMDDVLLRPAEDLDGTRRKALVVGVVGSVATVAGYFAFGPEVFYLSYLMGWIYWLGVALGLFMICLLTHVSGGRWGIMMHRVHIKAGQTVPLFAILGLPILFGGMEA
ncbi:MAG: hypothetical protein AAF725_19830, partial [Acidobacteriota bacterium]